jgi:hypothetical protein
VRDYINILDKGNWNLFAIYAGILWTLALVIVPAVLYALSFAGNKYSKAELKTKDVFLGTTASLLPLAMMLWIAFVIPMLFVNVTFVLQSFSDPFGWGWDFFGTANIPWHQFLPRAVPWFQSMLVLGGFYYSLRNLKRTFISETDNSRQLLRLSMPMGLFLFGTAVAMIFFFTN